MMVWYLGRLESTWPRFLVLRRLTIGERMSETCHEVLELQQAEVKEFIRI